MSTPRLAFPMSSPFQGCDGGTPDDVGLENTVLGLKQVLGHADAKESDALPGSA